MILPHSGAYLLIEMRDKLPNGGLSRVVWPWLPFFRALSDQLGKGFSRTNLISMRLCYIRYPDILLLSDQLTWGHYVELLFIDHDLERSFLRKTSDPRALDGAGTQAPKKLSHKSLFLLT